MRDIWWSVVLVKAENKLPRPRTSWEGGVVTFEKGRRCFRRGEEEHAERRGDSGGHDGGVEYDGPINGFASLLMHDDGWSGMPTKLGS